MAEETTGRRFEDMLKELEKIVQRLEEEDLPLEEALAVFEEGIRLSRHCSSYLDQAEKRIQLLTKNESGAPSVTEWEGDV
ncbi:MAG: exodeoxyribonuclease VII small subunit [Deltaproteobacteria bacterium]